MIDVYVTCKNKTEARKIANNLLQNNLAACVNMFPIDSMFWWDGKIQNVKEYAMLIKTNRSFKKIAEEIRLLHSYEIPCIEKITVDTTNKFKEWVNKESK